MKNKILLLCFIFCAMVFRIIMKHYDVSTFEFASLFVVFLALGALFISIIITNNLDETYESFSVMSKIVSSIQVIQLIYIMSQPFIDYAVNITVLFDIINITLLGVYILINSNKPIRYRITLAIVGLLGLIISFYYGYCYQSEKSMRLITAQKIHYKVELLNSGTSEDWSVLTQTQKNEVVDFFFLLLDNKNENIFNYNPTDKLFNGTTKIVNLASCIDEKVKMGTENKLKLLMIQCEDNNK